MIRWSRMLDVTRNSKLETLGNTVGNLLFPIIIFTILFSCQPEEELISNSSSLKLAISQDTLLFDTLLTNQGSITRRFRIFNPNNEAVKFSRIALGKGSTSDYSLIINGRETNDLQNEILFGKDSLQVLVSVFIDPKDENLPYLVKDSVVFDWNGNTEHVKLVAYGQDAVFVNADTLCNVTWTADRPYVIYNYALVDTLCMLTVDPGAQIFLDNGAGLFVKGSLKLLGTKDERITVKNTRFDARYQQAPGQWLGLIFLESSRNNEIHFSDILNGEIGVGIGYSISRIEGGIALLPENSELTASIEVFSSTIGHMSTAGILAFSSEVLCENSVVFNCGQYVVGNFLGGNYTYDHCTLVNEPNFFFREDPSVQFSDNIILSDNSLLVSDLNLRIRNTIIWGNEAEELLISESGETVITKDFATGILKSKIGTNSFFASQENNFPGFSNPYLFDYSLDTLSYAKDKGSEIDILTDIDGNLRQGKPDIGAYERIED